jgi:hypothetical protein
MSLRNRVILPIVALTSLALLVACGSSSNKATPPPTGGFTYSNLTGAYVFSTQGTDSSGAPITIAGAFTACGCSGETISGGTFSFFDPAVSTSPVSAQAISSGSYKITADGRGQVALPNSSALGNITLDFVLNSTAGGTVSEYDSQGTGSGTLEQQSSVTQDQIAGNYAFFLGGESSTGNFAAASAGAFTLSETGGVTAGVYDLTEYTFSTGTAGDLPDVALSTSSSVTVGTGTAPGAATIIDVSDNTYTFDVYAVSVSDLKFIETDGKYVASGDAFPQSSLPSGTLAFTMAGLDPTAFPLAVGGLLPVSSGTISGGLEDYNDGATGYAGGSTGTNSSVGGTFGGLSGGRATLQLTSFYNGATTGNGTYTFAAYPTASGLLLLEIDGLGITSGMALVQSNTTFASGQGYGVDLSATNISGGSGAFYEEDDIAEFTSTSTGFTGLVDVNDEGTTYFDETFDGSYSSASTGRYTFKAGADGSDFLGFSGWVYTVDGSTLLFLEGDQLQVGTGVFQVQSATGSASSAAAHAMMAFHRLAAKHAAKQGKK